MLCLNRETVIFHKESVRGNSKSFNFQLIFRTSPDELIRGKQSVVRF